MCTTERFARQGSFSLISKPGTAYPVNLTSRAERDLARIYERINVNDSDAALEWYHGFKQAILSLEKLRHLLYGNKPHIYRAIYRVMEKQKQVEVLHIRHGARRRFKRSDVA